MNENIFDFFFKISENVTILFSELCVVFGRSAPSSDSSNDLQLNRQLIQFSSVAQSCLTLRPHELQHARPPCPLPTPGVHSNSRPWSRWCHQPTHPLASPSPPAPNPSQYHSLFQWLNSSHEVAKYWSFSFSIIPSKEHPGRISLQSKGLSRVFSNTTVQKHQFLGAQLSSQPNSHIHTWPLEKP